METDRPVSPLVIRLFGPCDVRVNGRPLARLRSRNGQWLLALLTLRPGREVPRDWLAGLLWPESAQSLAFANLRRSLNDLRHALGAEAHRLRSPTPHTLCLDMTDAFCDVLAFDAAIAEGKRQKAKGKKAEEEGAALLPFTFDLLPLQEAVSLYHGPLLEGCLEEWALPERAAREQAYLSALETLAGHTMKAGDPAAAVRHLRCLLVADPLRESGVRSLMQTLAEQSDHAASVQVYRDFRLLLHHQLNTQPDAQTIALSRLLRAEARESAQPLPRSLAPSAPPLRRLPSPPTTFIGREAEREQLLSLLETTRLLTLTGTGGVGKTRLALAVAEEVAEEYREGVCFVDLAPLQNPAQVVQAVALALEVREEPNRPLQETLLDYLQARSLLLILDNCEHLTAACASLSETLLSRCPHLRLLATSRQPLGVAVERTWRVPSLTLPEGSEQEWETEKGAQAILMGSEAVQLFVERATSASCVFRLTRENLGDVAEICRLLDGIPLALELAAAWVRVMPVSQTVSRLRDRLDLLRSRHPGGLVRHQTLRATLDWSYGLLEAAEQRLLCRLSVFAGGWTLEAAEQVTGNRDEDRVSQVRASEGTADPRSVPCSLFPVPSDAVLFLLASLVDKSLVVYVEQEGEGRYRLLETTRQYAREKLQRSGEETATQGRHRDYFLRQLESGLDGRVEYYDWDRVKWDHQPEYHRWCEAERDNCREALRFSLEEPEGAKAALQMAARLWSFWLDTGNHREGRTWLNAALQKDDGSPGRERLRVLRSAGVLAMMQGDYPASRRLTEEGLAMAREREPGFVVHLLDVLGYLTDPGQQQQHIWEERVALAREDGDPALIADALVTLGKCLMHTGHEAEARPVFEEALDYAVRSQDTYYIIFVKGGMADLEGSEGSVEEAHRLLQEIIGLLREAGDNPHALSWPCLNMGRVKQAMGDYAAMRAHFAEAIRCFQRVGSAECVIYTLGEIAKGEYSALAEPTTQEAEWCARLFGAAERQRLLRELPPYNKDRPLSSDSVSQIRAALGEEAFARACAAGAAMALDEAVEYALREQAGL